MASSRPRPEQGKHRIKGALEGGDFRLQLIKISGHQEGKFLAAEELEFLFDGAKLLAVAVLDVEAGHAVGPAGLQVGIGGNQAHFEGGFGRQSAQGLVLWRRDLPIPAGERKGEARVGNPARHFGRAVGCQFHIGQEAIENGAEPRVEIALKGLLEQIGKQEGGRDKQDDGYDSGGEDQTEGK